MNAITKEFEQWSRFETIFFTLSLILVLACSVIKGDEILAIIASVFGLIYTFSAGKGKIYCYFFGIISTIACGYIAFRTALFGTAILYFSCYLPMEIIGILEWRKHLIQNTNEIIKTKLGKKDFLIFCIVIYTCALMSSSLFKLWGDSSPIIDSFVFMTSIAAMFMTIKRCIEQWALWTISNILSVYMWFEVFMNGEKTFSIFVIRIVYLVLGIYFFLKWRIQLKSQRV